MAGDTGPRDIIDPVYGFEWSRPNRITDDPAHRPWFSNRGLFFGFADKVSSLQRDRPNVSVERYVVKLVIEFVDGLLHNRMCLLRRPEMHDSLREFVKHSPTYGAVV